MPEHTANDRRPSRWAVGAGIGFFMLTALFWIAIFSGVFTHRNPDKLYDQAWVDKAGQICTPAANGINALPNASTSKSPADRAELLDRGTAILKPMLAKLDALSLPQRASDRKVVNGFLTDWQTYLGDRRKFAASLRTNPKARPLVSDVHGGQVTDAIDAMANANNVTDCATPTDM